MVDAAGHHRADDRLAVPSARFTRARDDIRRERVSFCEYGFHNDHDAGLVGNSGNATEPHLHFHISDGPALGTSTLGAEGIPYALPSFQVVGKCTISAAGLSCTRHAPVTVRGGMPLENQIVVFPK